MNRVLRPIVRLFQADVLDAPLLHPRLCFYEVGLARGLREFGGYRATSTRRPMLLSISAISLSTSIGYALRVGVGSKLHPMARKKTR
jgi:hypothetical protein